MDFNDLTNEDAARTSTPTSPTLDLSVVVGISVTLLVFVGTVALVVRALPALRLLLDLGRYGFIAVVIICLVCSARQVSSASRNMLLVSSIIGAVLAVFTWLLSPPVYATVHPVFRTPVSGRAGNRPAVMVTVTDDTELGGLGTAELYLSVQSSRFPSDVQVILPINRGSFQGCQQKFVQLPFEVTNGDDLTFDLLDDNLMTPEQEQRVLDACKAAGFCVEMGGTICQPELHWLIHPTTGAASQVLGRSIVLHNQDSPFRNFGNGVFIVQSSRPTTPHEANPITLLNSSQYSRASVRVYFPASDLP